MQQLFGRDATAQGAGAAEPFVFLDNCDFQAQLPGANRGHIAARTAADYRYIELFVSQFGRFLSLWRNPDTSGLRQPFRLYF